LLAHQPSEVISTFALPSLKTRLGQALLEVSSNSVEDTAAIFQLWAAAELVGAEILVYRVRWPVADIARQSVEAWPHPETIEGMGYIQQQLWMGIRLFSCHHPGAVPMPENVVNDALLRWKKTALEPDRTAARKGWDSGMIRWLEQCVASGGRTLIRDCTPLRTALAPITT
jgi:hypothetical protein